MKDLRFRGRRNKRVLLSFTEGDETANVSGIMRKAFALLILTLTLAVAALFAGLVGAEPSYAGHPLSHWVLTLKPAKPYLFSKELAEQEAAREALKQIGSEAIPCLLSWLEKDPAPWRLQACSWLNKKFKTHFSEDYQERAIGASLAFQFVGPVDEKTKEKLLKLVYSPDTPIAERAAAALLPITKDNPLYQNIALLKVADPFCQSIGLAGFKRMGEEGRPGIPLLIDCLRHKNPGLASKAAEVLRLRYSTDPRVIVALKEWESHPRWQNRTNLAVGLVRR